MIAVYSMTVEYEHYFIYLCEFYFIFKFLLFIHNLITTLLHIDIKQNLVSPNSNQ